MVNCGFNTLIPALAFQLRIFAVYPIGELPTGLIWSNGNSVGTLKSVPGFDIAVNATSLHMDDFTVATSNGPLELRARGMFKTDDGQYIGVTGKGLLAGTPHVKAIIANETGVKPMKWGEIDTLQSWTIQASGKYEALTQSTFISNMRLSPSNNSDTTAYVEFRLSRVLTGPVSACESESEAVFPPVHDATIGEL
ncbi:hypothetical protein F5X97DRAFT_253788 [Nemania serpens]|nr:hypothetical protein F5X97DRAFT_253788 [Nemania serpens]